jgi:hypothetical protein
MRARQSSIEPLVRDTASASGAAVIAIDHGLA